MRNNKIKIVVDTNVFINGLIFSSENKDDENVINILFNLIDNDVVELVFSQDTIGELIYILKNKLIHYVDNQKWEKHMCRIIILFLYSYSINTKHTIAPKCKDPNDDMFLKCAVKSKAKYLISDDLKSNMGEISLLDTTVLTAKEFISEYNKSNQSEQEIASEEEYNDEE